MSSTRSAARTAIVKRSWKFDVSSLLSDQRQLTYRQSPFERATWWPSETDETGRLKKRAPGYAARYAASVGGSTRKFSTRQWCCAPSTSIPMPKQLHTATSRTVRCALASRLRPFFP